MLWRRVLIAGIATLVLAPATLHGAPEDRGPFPIASWDAGGVPIGEIQIPTTVYYADTASVSGPMLVIMHGTARGGGFHRELASALASRGFLVAVPDMPCGLGGCDHRANAGQLSQILEWLEATSGDSSTPIFRRGNGRRGLIGHSYGGLAAFLAAANDSSVEAMVLLDPKDDARAADRIAADFSTPSAHLMAEVRGLCNDDWATAVFPEIPAPRLRLRVRGAGHCDVEDPTDGLCALACSAGNAATTPIFRRYAVAFLECVFQGSSSAVSFIGGDGLVQDEATGLVDLVELRGVETFSCWTQNPGLDGGVLRRQDGSLEGDSGSSEPPDGGSGSAAGDEDGEGCGCLALERPTSQGANDGLWVLAGLLLLARRARSKDGCR